MRRFLVSLAFAAIFSNLFSQRARSVEGNYIFRIPADRTLEQAKREALTQAQLQAVADVFGTVVSESVSSYMAVENGHTDSRLYSLGSADVRGEWIETTAEPQYFVEVESNEYIIQVEVKGKAREISNASADFVAKTLRNGTELKFEDTAFRNGDEMYLYFRTPARGYLTVYMLDHATDVCYLLLPYRDSDGTAVRVERDKDYIFFSPDTAPENKRREVDEYVLTTELSREMNDLFVVFSPKEFVKAGISDSGSNVIPQNLSIKNFHKWLANIRKRDSAVACISIPVTITKE